MTEISEGEPKKDETMPAEKMSRETVGGNEKSGGWRNWLKRFSRTAVVTTAIGGTALGLGKAIEHQYDNNVVRQETGQPIEGATPFPAILINSEDSNGNEITPTFWTHPEDTSKKLSIEELKEMGIDPHDPNLKILDIEGQTYAAAGELGSHKGKDGKDYGAWGEIVVTDPSTGKDKRTGIFVPGKYIDEKPQDPKPGE